MTKVKPPRLPWTEEDDRSVVKAMLQDRQSEHWKKCSEFVEKLVHKHAKNFSPDARDDTIQEAMIKIRKYLPLFKHGCSLKTWLFRIVRSCIIDDHRKITHGIQHVVLPTAFHDFYEDGESNDVFSTQQSRTAEEDFMIRDELNNAIAALREYIIIHKKRERNAKILSMVLFEARSLEEAAITAGCSAAVAGYVVRSAQRYVREKLGLD